MIRTAIVILLAAFAHAGFAGADRTAQEPQPVASPVPPLPVATPSAFPTPAPYAPIPSDDRPFEDDSDADGITADIESGDLLDRWTSFVVQFPEAIVNPDRIDSADGPSPLAVWPPVDASFTWRSQTQGRWHVVGPLVPGQEYRFRLDKSLKTLAGEALPTNSWGLALQTAPLTVTELYGERPQLSAAPQIPLEFNYPIDLHSVTDGVWIQDRKSRTRFPVDVLLNLSTDAVAGETVDVSLPTLPPLAEFRVRPREPLPVGAFYDLVVDHPRDAYSGRTLPFPKVFPLGRTKPLAVDFVAARNWPTDKPHIEVKFTATLDDEPLPADAITIEPPVEGLSLIKAGESIIAEGGFDTSQRYVVTISKDIEGERGYSLAEQSTWGATFRPKAATILFPGGTLFRQRTALGLRFALVQANTGPVSWRLAPIPLDRFALIRAEPLQPDPWNDNAPKPAVVMEKYNLKPVAEGHFPAAMNDEEVLRTVTWPGEEPSTTPLSGPYLFEARAHGADGKTVVNQAIIVFSETVVTRKVSGDGVTVRLAEMGTGKPIAAVPVQVVTSDLRELLAAETDSMGIATFPKEKLAGGAYFLARTPAGLAFDAMGSETAFSSGNVDNDSSLLLFTGTILTDRPLYRPGQTVHFKGIVRQVAPDGSLEVPANEFLEWRIVAGGDDEIASGSTRTDEFGGWDALWIAPEGGRLGSYSIEARSGLHDAGETNFQVEEYRNPAFSVICEAQPQSTPATSSITVASHYFHGAPNVGSRVNWTATWYTGFAPESDEDGFYLTDEFSEHRTEPTSFVEVSGEAVLDMNGMATLTTAAPFKDPGNRAVCSVNWSVTVTGPDGQSIPGRANQDVVMNNITLGVRPDQNSTLEAIAFDLRTIARDQGAIPVPSEVSARLYLVHAKSVKERIAPFIYRYQNTNVFEEVDARKVAANGRFTFKPTEPGRYVLVASPLEGQAGIPVSAELYITGPGEAELPISNEQRLEISPVDPKTPAFTGQTASLNVKTPSPGVGWLSVETDRILASRTVEIDGNLNRLEIPISNIYVPNVFVSLYLLRPGGKTELPGEMFGYTPLEVTNPASRLGVEIRTDRPKYQPGQTIEGEIRISSNGAAVENADVAVWVVDDSVLSLADWVLPDILPTFFPRNRFGVTTYTGLAGYVADFNPETIGQKGFVIGDSRKEFFEVADFARKNFKPLILWLPSVRTDSSGIARFKCQAPDNLTTFRVVAVAQTQQSQFGTGNGTFTTSKPLLLESALPRFVREGDEVELRVIGRQSAADQDEITIACEAPPEFQLLSPPSVTVSASRNAPAVATFKARSTGESPDVAPAAFTFSAKGASGLTDLMEISLAVASRSIIVDEMDTGVWNDTGGRMSTFSAAAVAPAGWKGANGRFDVTLSTSDVLPHLAGIPSIIDYPHGCFEQKSSRLLVYTALNRLLHYLPLDKTRSENYQRVISQTLQEMAESETFDGRIPYWPHEAEGNTFVTIQAAWSAIQAIKAGIEIDDSLGLQRELRQMIDGETRYAVTPTLKAFALFVLSEAMEEPDDELQATAHELFLTRDRMSHEGHAWLALALARMDALPDERQQLLASLPTDPTERSFDPETFSSSIRTRALCAWARALDDSNTSTSLQALEAMMSDAHDLSTQENLWLLAAFNDLLDRQENRPIGDAEPQPTSVSPNASAAAWSNIPMTQVAEFTVGNLATSGSYMIAGDRELPVDQQTPLSKGMTIERVIKNLTDPTRTGDHGAPFALGDQLLISYRFSSDKPESFVALVDQLPAGIETVNPNLAMFADSYDIPDDPNASPAALSFSEMRDQQTNLYFNSLPAGSHSTAILARATTAGTFAWPSTTISPMYDARVQARTAASTCVIR